MIYRVLLVSVLIYLMLPTSSFAKDRFLQGRVLLVGEHDELKPLVGQDVTLVESGDATRTKEGGRFRLFLKDIFKPGTRVTLSVEKKGWRIQYPLEGDARVPDDLDKELVEIRLLPIGSKKFWSADRIEKFIRDTAEKAKEQIRPEGKPQDIDFSRYIKDWAVKYGFSAQQAKAEIDKWVAEAEKKNDPYQLGLAAYVKKNFGEAGIFFEESATGKVRRAQEASTTARGLADEAIRDFRLAGDAHSNNYQFDRALFTYQKARDLTSQVNQPRLWADLTIFVARAEYNIGLTTEGAKIHHHLGRAAEACRTALAIYTRESLPQQWAQTQLNLGTVLIDQGRRTDGKESLHLLALAETAYRDALTVLTKESLPQDWGKTQWGLGNALSDQGRRTDDKESLHLLALAVTAYREAFTVLTKDRLPQDWAGTQASLGNVLTEQGIRASGGTGSQLLTQAVEAYRAALTVYTKEHLPQYWAGTQTSLGDVLRQQGIRTPGPAGTQLLADAITAYQEALTVLTKDQLPQYWAGTQASLARVSLDLEDWPTSVEALRNVLMLYPDHIEAYQASNAVYHDKLFAYQTAFEITKQWLDRHPEDVSAQVNFAEAHLTTEHYDAAERQVGELLKKPDLNPTSSVGLRIDDIVIALALKKMPTVPQKIQELRTYISDQPENFHANWSFDGTRHYIKTEEVFAPYRAWLMDLFAIVKSEDRAALLDSLGRVQASFNP